MSTNKPESHFPRICCNLVHTRKACPDCPGTAAEQAAQESAKQTPKMLSAKDALAAIDNFEIVGENNDSREPNNADRFMLSEFIAHCFDGYRIEESSKIAGISDAARDVLAERVRQMSDKGWTASHDDAHACGEIAAFAAVYAMPEGARDWPTEETGYGATLSEALTPDGWQPKFGERRRDLVKAGALILAEIERLDRRRRATRG
ncbi:hypothetical protein F4827_005038 [Paraburkholderia bannensis]|uniref:Uncharacterized protein n=1 Tax=Paraburkholderia bannensis TaxID=765414 RepID=A0A7W9U172_9BURK|nr:MULTISPECIES: hypothetical protein [Paraburkholderia]MBB3259966.1 hypothetical protein [Paraburkholderia sp. WP4_3_2]MBB6105172.1 hypothetical protein [Paraburkholderia bannensis]